MFGIYVGGTSGHVSKGMSSFPRPEMARDPLYPAPILDGRKLRLGPTARPE